MATPYSEGAQTSLPPLTQLDPLETTLHGSIGVTALGASTLLIDVGVVFRHSGWAPNRNRVLRAFEQTEDAGARCARFRTCGAHAWVFQDPQDADHYRVACNKCRDRFCVPCANERSSLIRRALLKFCEKRDLRFITLTLAKSTRTLSQDIDRLYAAFARLRRLSVWTHTQKGGVHLLEIKRRKSADGWHAHLHVIVEGSWISKSWLSHAWNRVTGDSYIVDIRRVTSTEHAARYVCKYVGKGVHGDVYRDPALLAEAMEAVSGRRLIGKFGTFRDLSFDATDPTEGWIVVGSLALLHERARRGCDDAQHIINLLLESSPCNQQDHNSSPRGP